MKKLLLPLTLFASVLLLSNSALGYNLLQLDIDDSASYSNGTIVTGDPMFDVVALLNPDSGLFNKVSLATNFYLVVSWNSTGGTYPNNEFTLDGDPISLDTTIAPPTNPQLNHGELGSYAFIKEFTFDPDNRTTAYNTQDYPGGFAGDVGGPFYFQTFSVDVSNLSPFVPIHFDLFAYTGGNPEKVFAPFSHDASAVPEPATMILLGFGLLGLVGFRRKFRKA